MGLRRRSSARGSQGVSLVLLVDGDGTRHAVTRDANPRLSARGWTTWPSPPLRLHAKFIGTGRIRLHKPLAPQLSLEQLISRSLPKVTPSAMQASARAVRQGGSTRAAARAQQLEDPLEDLQV